MSTSLRDQLLKAGLISKKQANEAERQQQRQARPMAPAKRHPKSARAPVPERVPDAKIALDRELNRRQRDKAEKKARAAEIRQLIESNRLPQSEVGQAYHFVDGAKIRRIAVDAAVRDRLSRGELAIVRHGGRYDVVPAAIATRVRERDANAFVSLDAARDVPRADDAYGAFPVPDDLIW